MNKYWWLIWIFLCLIVTLSFFWRQLLAPLWGSNKRNGTHQKIQNNKCSMCSTPLVIIRNYYTSSSRLKITFKKWDSCHNHNQPLGGVITQWWLPFPASWQYGAWYRCWSVLKNQVGWVLACSKQQTLETGCFQKLRKKKAKAKRHRLVFWWPNTSALGPAMRCSNDTWC